MSTGSVELRAGILHNCQCNRRDGLQDFCPRSECGGPLCRTEPEPLCGPANGKSLRRKPADPATSLSPADSSGVRRLASKSSSKRDHFVRKGREGYIDNPALPPYRFTPCAVHCQNEF